MPHKRNQKPRNTQKQKYNIYLTQPIKYYDCPVGIEMANHKSNGEEVIIASVQSLGNRLNKFKPNDFDMIITDEAHHARS